MDDVGRGILEAGLEAFPKGTAWWSPPHNLAVNEAAMGYNLWRFSILPRAGKAYLEPTKMLVLRQAWVPADARLYRDLPPELATKIVSVAKQANTLQEEVRRELAWIENQFQIRIPLSVQVSLTKDVVTVARRRWGVDMLRVKPLEISIEGTK